MRSDLGKPNVHIVWAIVYVSSIHALYTWQTCNKGLHKTLFRNPFYLIKRTSGVMLNVLNLAWLNASVIQVIIFLNYIFHFFFKWHCKTGIICQIVPLKQFADHLI